MNKSDFLTHFTLSDDGRDQLGDAVEFLSQIEVDTCKGVELEMVLQHTAYLVNPDNEFVNNTNIGDGRRDLFYSIVDLMHESDIDTWCRKLGESHFWRASNNVICNVVWNWLRGSLDEPVIFMER